MSNLIGLGARQVRVVNAVKGRNQANGDEMVVIAFGDRLSGAEYLAMSVAEAIRLSERLVAALDTPPPASTGRRAGDNVARSRNVA